MRLMLIAHAAGRGDLSDAARARAAEVARVLPRPRAAECSPGREAVQTAQALGYPVTAAPALADWRRDDGETLQMLLSRVAGWLGVHRDDQGTRAAITHGAVVRAAVVHVLRAPAEAFWAFDVEPCSVTELTVREGRWHLAHLNWAPALLHIPQRRGRRRAGRSG
jgi:broad specificity phosphatase PhoE